MQEKKKCKRKKVMITTTLTPKVRELLDVIKDFYSQSASIDVTYASIIEAAIISYQEKIQSKNI